MEIFYLNKIISATGLFLDTMNHERLCSLICDEINETLGASSTKLYLVEGEGFILQEAIHAIDILDNKLLGDLTKQGVITSSNEIVEKKLELILRKIMEGDNSKKTINELKKYFHNSSLTYSILRTASAGQVGVIVVVDDPKRKFTKNDNDFLFAISDVAAQVLRIESIISERESRDGLTGLYNQKYFKHSLHRELERIRRYGGKMSLVMLDIDFFKRKNDKYGHLAGDKILKDVSQFVANSTRLTDVVSRYGGEEFAVLLINASLKDAQLYAEHVRSNIEKTDIWPEQVTISAGITNISSANKIIKNISENDIINAADQALYTSKEQGRNRITINRI